MADKTDQKGKMVMPRDGVLERGYHPPKEENPPKNPPKGGITVTPAGKPKAGEK
jgi:hypothetical protein